jgi:hypothetical protein
VLDLSGSADLYNRKAAFSLHGDILERLRCERRHRDRSEVVINWMLPLVLDQKPTRKR